MSWTTPRTWVASEVVTAAMLNTHIRDNLNYLFSSIYPVGSIYINANVSTNPATLLGFGTWTAFGAGRMMVGFDSGQTEFDSAEETGGSKTHTLVSGEMPSHTHTQDAHTHTLYMPAGDGGFSQTDDAGSGNGSVGSAMAGASLISSTTATNQNTGGGGSHNNLPPYITCYFWKRTA